ncbi:hypothetical protein EYF80_049952 [Liparis tanakae]|uniref:Uncharacterized protein n=1 Tax=Liparis tanakae TaxID=230148 RepID=A0A4Z2FG60_9TELE|nr:hypothetical protein EYF80_049952 [Liparis tanakae]
MKTLGDLTWSVVRSSVCCRRSTPSSSFSSRDARTSSNSCSRPSSSCRQRSINSGGRRFQVADQLLGGLQHLLQVGLQGVGALQETLRSRGGAEGSPASRSTESSSAAAPLSEASAWLCSVCSRSDDAAARRPNSSHSGRTPRHQRRRRSNATDTSVQLEEQRGEESDQALSSSHWDQGEPLQSGHLALQARHYALPPLEGAVRDPPGQLLQNVKVVAQEPGELLDTQEATASSRRYHVSGELLLQLGSAVQLVIGPPGQACGAQSQQPLQAVDQALVVALQLHADRELLAVRENATQRTVQLPLWAEDEAQV